MLAALSAGYTLLGLYCSTLIWLYLIQLWLPSATSRGLKLAGPNNVTVSVTMHTGLLVLGSLLHYFTLEFVSLHLWFSQCS
jgi:hypothetical protein